ncbi:MFS transporter [Planosporangium mesophilum]|nr:MFS transporter [Planosporangium mesophilum]
MALTRVTRLPAGAGRSGGNRVFRGWWIVAALAVTQTVGYGALYYAFAVLLQPMARDLHASATVVTGALTASTLAGAVMAVPVGRWLDRHGGRGLMTTGSLAATALLAAWSQVHTVAQLYAVLVGVGLTSAMVLYEPAFAVVVAWFDPGRRANALLAITVVAGFASSVFLPVTGLLVDRYGWREALLLLAVLHGAVTVPLHALVLRRPPTGPAPSQGHPLTSGRGRAVRDTRFWILAVGFVAHSAAVSALTVHLVAYLISRGHPATFAAGVAGLLGILSVTGRVVLTGAQRRVRPSTVVAAIFALQALAAASLPLAAASRTGAVIAVVGFGLGFGAATIARPTMLADRYGTSGYATISGLLTVPVTLAKAGAPLAAAGLMYAAGGYTPVWVAVAVCCAVAAAGMLTRAGAAPPP